MIVDLDKQTGPAANLTPDVCIVGGGALGITLATALARAGADVLLLEGGGAGLEPDSQALQAGESIGQPFQNIGVGRYRVLGGTTLYWGGQLLPFDPFVTGPRPWAGHAAWPMAAAELEHWHARTWTLLGLDGLEMQDREVWRRAGIDASVLGPDIELIASRWLRTRNLANLFGTELRAARGPRVMLHANAVALEMDVARQSVAAVHVRSLRGAQVVVRPRRTVLANGTLEIVRLLLHPLADGRTGPWEGNPWLGVPLIDHLDCHAADVEVLNHRAFHDLFDNVYLGGRMYHPKIRLTPEVQRNEGLVDIAGEFYYRTRFTEHLDYLKLFLRSLREGSGEVPWGQLPRHLAAALKAAGPLALRYFRDRRSFKPHDAEVGLTVYCEQLPCPRSRVLLGPQRDALGLQRLAVDWQIDGREIASMRRFARAIDERLRARGLAQLTLVPGLESLSPAVLSQVRDSVHQMGTARMAASPSEGVVDPNLRVHGTDNLFVAGAAAFPSTGHANPTFTAMALGQRLAAHLAAAR